MFNSQFFICFLSNVQVQFLVLTAAESIVSMQAQSVLTASLGTKPWHSNNVYSIIAKDTVRVVLANESWAHIMRLLHPMHEILLCTVLKPFHLKAVYEHRSLKV